MFLSSEARWRLFCTAMSSVNQLRPGSSPMYVSPAAHFSQTGTSAMTVPPPSYMLPQRHQPSPQPTSAPPRTHDDRDQKNNALVILKMLCETPLLQAYLLDLLKARSYLLSTVELFVVTCLSVNSICAFRHCVLLEYSCIVQFYRDKKQYFLWIHCVFIFFLNAIDFVVHFGAGWMVPMSYTSLLVTSFLSWQLLGDDSLDTGSSSWLWLTDTL